jgi:hypothetical protein
MQCRVSLEKQQLEMVERLAAKRARRWQNREGPKPKPERVRLKPKRKLDRDQFVEIMEQIIDDLGLDVPRREHKQLTA